MPEMAKIAGFYTNFGKHFRFSLSRTLAATPMLTNSASCASHIIGATMGPMFTHIARIPATIRAPIQPAPRSAKTRALAHGHNSPNTGSAPATIGAHDHTGQNWHTIAHWHGYGHTMATPILAHTKPAPIPAQ